MIQKKFFEKHYSRLRTQGIIKAALSGLMVGLFATFVTAVFAWFFDFGGIWFGLAVGAGVAIVCGIIMYFAKYKPTTKQIAQRVDLLGLEERLITMLELQQDESYIAMLQRENAKEHLKYADHRKLRLRLSKTLVILAVVAALLAAGMTTVVGLAESDIVPSGTDIVTPEDPMEGYISVSYMAEEGGEIEGETDQLVLAGESTTPVVAIPDDGWIFVGWEDGVGNPERYETNVTENMLFIAIFEQIGEGGEGGESDGEGGQENGSAEGDSAEDVPGEGAANVDSEQNGGEGDEGNGSGSDANNDGGKGETDEKGEGKGDGKGQGAGGKWQNSNQFIDGNTYYRDYLDMYYEMAQEIFEQEGEIPPEMREFFENYFNGI